MQIAWKDKRDIQRLNERKNKLATKHCIYCQIKLSAFLTKGKRTYLYCRDCQERLTIQIRRHKWNRYYDRNRERLKAQAKERMRLYRLTKLNVEV